MLLSHRLALVGVVAIVVVVCSVVVPRAVLADSKCGIDSWELERIAVYSESAPEDRIETEVLVWMSSGSLEEDGTLVSLSACKCGEFRLEQ